MCPWGHPAAAEPGSCEGVLPAGLVPALTPPAPARLMPQVPPRGPLACVPLTMLFPLLQGCLLAPCPCPRVLALLVLSS